VFGHGADVFLKDDGLSWGRKDHLSEPSERGRAAGRATRLAEIVAAHQDVETKHGIVFHRRDIDGGEVT
jgi:hypothetical protein